MIDDHSRVAYAEIHDDEKGVTAAGVLERAITFYATLGVRVERVISDNAFAYRHSAAFRSIIEAHAIQQKFIKPHCPWTNGKVERLNRTLATEWAYARAWTSNRGRAAALQSWLDYYNLDRAHLGIGGSTPIDRINNDRVGAARAAPVASASRTCSVRPSVSTAAPARDDADWGMVRIEASGLLPMCGHGTIGVDTVLVETGMVDRFLSAPIEGHRVFRRQRSGTLHAFMPDA